MQLLSVGRSLCGINDEPSRYKMTQANLLPTFGTAKDSGKTDASNELARAASLPAGKSPKSAPKPAPNQESTKMTPQLETEEAGPPAPSVAALKPPAQAYPLGRWTLPKNPFASKSATAKPPKGPVQCQLSIEAVKVVRNDLSDSDLEVVPSPNPLTPSPAVPAKKFRESLEAISLAWGRITARILGVGRTH